MAARRMVRPKQLDIRRDLLLLVRSTLADDDRFEKICIAVWDGDREVSDVQDAAMPGTEHR